VADVFAAGIDHAVWHRSLANPARPANVPRNCRGTTAPSCSPAGRWST